MDIVEFLKQIFTSPWLYGGIFVMALVSYGVIRRYFRKFPIVNSKMGLLMVSGVMFLAVTGMLGSMSWGTGSLTSDSGSWSISEVQITNLAANDSAASVALDGSNIYLIQARYTDAQANENTGNEEIVNATFTITRTGKLPADSCRVSISSPEWTIDETTGTQGTAPFNILEKDATGRYKTYFADSTTFATTSDSQGGVSVAFAEGVSQETFTMLLNVDEESHDALNQYSTRDATVDICGFPVVVRVSRM